MKQFILLFILFAQTSVWAQKTQKVAQNKAKAAVKTRPIVKAKIAVAPKPKVVAKSQKTKVTTKPTAKYNAKAKPITKANAKIALAKTKGSTAAKTLLVKGKVANKNTKMQVVAKADKNTLLKAKAKSALAKQKLNNRDLAAKPKAKKPLLLKVKKVIPTAEIHRDVVAQVPQEKFEMLYPTGFFSTEIKEHYGKIKIGDVYYDNEGVTLSTNLDREVECNVDSAIVSDVYEDEDGAYIVSLKHKHYTIVMANLAYAAVQKGDELIQGDFIGIVNADVDQNNKASLELMLLRDNKIMNPEKYLVRQLTPKVVPILGTITK